PIESIAGYLVGIDIKTGKTRDVTLIESNSKKSLDLKVICPTKDVTAQPSDIVNSMMYDTLKKLIDQHETTLVFTNTRSGAEGVVYKLKERGLNSVEVHHSSLSRETRLNVEERLKQGEIKCVVSSTSLELGIDIGSVDLVCQIGSPKSVAKGLQRIGRSGHSMGKIAKGRLLVFDPDDLVECAVMCQAAHSGNIDRVRIPENCLDVLSQTIVGMSLGSRWNVDDAFSVVRGSYCYRNLTKEKFVSVLKYLGSKDEYEGVYSKIWYDEKENVFGRKKGSRMIYFMNLGTIPEEANYRVITNHGSVVGELSEKFVERLSAKDIFVLGGRSFEFVRSKGMIAYVKEATGMKPTVPSWVGEMLPRSFDLSINIAKFRTEMCENLEMNDNDLMFNLESNFDIDEGCARSVISYFKEQKTVFGNIPNDKFLFIEEYIDPSDNQKLIFHFPFGRRVNDALSRGYAYRISNMIGVNVFITMSDDNFMIGTSRKIDISKIAGMLTSKNLEAVLRKAIRDSEIFKLRFRHTAVRSFMILKNYRGRSVSVNRQHTRSSYLLNALSDIENMPVIEETYREVLEDDMDIKNAQVVLNMIESGKMCIKTIGYTGTPSPFAHSIILSGFSDIILMEDRSALLRQLHRKVLYRTMGDKIKEFEFNEEQIVPYFREKIGRILEKNDILDILSRIGPLQVMKERGRNIYAYSDVDKKVVDGWVRELIKEGKIGFVFLDEPYAMISEEIPYYASATKKNKELTLEDKKIIDCVGNEFLTLSDISTKLNIDENVVFRCIRKLESMYIVTRVGIFKNNKWSFGHYKGGFYDVHKSSDRIIMRFLEYFAPATIQEISFALSMSETIVNQSLEALIGDEEVIRGHFLISENDQYMRKLDYMRLKANKNNIFDYNTVERYRFHKCPKFKTIMEYFDYYESAGSEIDVFNRVENFDLREWYNLRSSGKILLGRFLKGRVRFVTAELGSKIASTVHEPILPEDEALLNVIRRLGTATMKQLIQETSLEKKAVKESLYRLDKALRVIRAFNEKDDGGIENNYQVYEPSITRDDPTPDLVEMAIRAYGPIPPMAIKYIIGTDPQKVVSIAQERGASTILVGEGQTAMLVMNNEISKITEYISDSNEVRICSLFDPDLGSKWAEISSRYGDKWIYPMISNGHVVGAAEIWEMSGCIEIRSMDMNDPVILPEVLKAVDRFMHFFNMKGVDIIRIREILTKDAADLDTETVKILSDNGYKFINGFYAKGKFISKSFSEIQILSYVFRKQRILPSNKYPTVCQALRNRGYIRADAEILTRVVERTSMKKQMECENIVRMALISNYIGYTLYDYVNLYRSAKEYMPDENSKIVLSIIQKHQPVLKKDIVSNSPMTEKITIQALNELFHNSVIYQDSTSAYNLVSGQKIDRYEALKKIVKMYFKDFGIFTAHNLYHLFTGVKASIIRRILQDLENEGLVVKGFLMEDDPTLAWMLTSDVDKPIRILCNEMFLLNVQDNLHVYLREYIKKEIGRTENVIFKGTKIVGSFKGKLTANNAKIEEFKGSSESERFLKKILTLLGVKIDNGRKTQEDKDWDVAEFYIKTNPG
ncbi:MAG: ATP-dependent helicase, partial [archaeon]|nr:ATP-dependent helicase [archaeon]